MHPLLHIKNLCLSFETAAGPVQALQAIDLTVHKGEVMALVGESGSGKSVTSMSILQLLPAPPATYTAGEILFSPDGRTQEDLLKKNKYDLQHIRGHLAAMIFQEPMTSLNPVMTCGKQVAEALIQHKKISAADARMQAINWFSRVQLPDPEHMFDRYPHQLSGGQKQRVMIAMAMCCEPALLICDEPTTALDVTVQQTILTLIKELQQQTGMGVIFITHDLGVVAEIADRAAVMYKGEIVEENTIAALFQNPRHAYTRALLACRPVNHPRGSRLPVVSDFWEHGKEKTTASADPLPSENKTAAVFSEELVRVENLSVHFPARRNFFGKPITYTRAVDNLSFSIFKGETLGLVGESGCGKTTLGRTLLRLIDPTAGKIWYNGKELTASKKTALSDLRQQIQIVFQDPYSSLNPRITIGEAIAEPLQVHRIGKNRAARKEKVVALLEKVNLQADHYDRYPHEFSGGQRQRIVIARALALSPSFVVCDESVSALDVSVQAQVLNLLNDLKKEFGFTIVFISHDLSVVRYISDRIMVMNKGKIEEAGLADDIYLHPQTEYTRKLIAAIPKGLVPGGLLQ